METNIAGQLAEAIRNYEEHLRTAAKGNSLKESALRWSKAHIPYKVIAPFMTRENLVLLAQQKMSRRLLVSLSRRQLRHEDRFLFWEDILSSSDLLPKEWRAEIFLDCFTSSENWRPCERNGTQPYYHFRDYDKERLSNYVVSSKWLVDAPLVRKWYCQLHKPGFEVLRCIDSRHAVKFPLREKQLEHIRQDDLPGFALLHTMLCQGSGWFLVQDVLRNNAHGIFAWLVENDASLLECITPFQLMVYAVANCSSKTAISAVECLEQHFPGTASKTDEFGNQPLWYCLHNKRIVWFSETEPLVAFLGECGCRREARNHLGLSFDDICQALTAPQKHTIEKVARNLSKCQSRQLPR